MHSSLLHTLASPFSLILKNCSALMPAGLICSLLFYPLRLQSVQHTLYGVKLTAKRLLTWCAWDRFSKGTICNTVVATSAGGLHCVACNQTFTCLAWPATTQANPLPLFYLGTNLLQTWLVCCQCGAMIRQQLAASLQRISRMPSNMSAARRAKPVIGHITMDCAQGLTGRIKNCY